MSLYQDETMLYPTELAIIAKLIHIKIAVMATESLPSVNSSVAWFALSKFAQPCNFCKLSIPNYSPTCRCFCFQAQCPVPGCVPLCLQSSTVDKHTQASCLSCLSDVLPPCTAERRIPEIHYQLYRSTCIRVKP